MNIILYLTYFANRYKPYGDSVLEDKWLVFTQRRSPDKMRRGQGELKER